MMRVRQQPMKTLSKPLPDKIMQQILEWLAWVSPQEAKTARLISKKYITAMDKYRWTFAPLTWAELDEYADSKLPLHLPILHIDLSADLSSAILDSRPPSPTDELEVDYSNNARALNRCNFTAPCVVLFNFLERFRSSPPVLPTVFCNTIKHLTLVESDDNFEDHMYRPPVVCDHPIEIPVFPNCEDLYIHHDLLEDCIALTGEFPRLQYLYIVVDSYAQPHSVYRFRSIFHNSRYFLPSGVRIAAVFINGLKDDKGSPQKWKQEWLRARPIEEWKCWNIAFLTMPYRSARNL